MTGPGSKRFPRILGTVAMGKETSIGSAAKTRNLEIDWGGSCAFEIFWLGHGSVERDVGMVAFLGVP